MARKQETRCSQDCTTDRRQALMGMRSGVKARMHLSNRRRWSSGRVMKTTRAPDVRRELTDRTRCQAFCSDTSASLPLSLPHSLLSRLVRSHEKRAAVAGSHLLPVDRGTAATSAQRSPLSRWPPSSSRTPGSMCDQRGKPKKEGDRRAADRQASKFQFRDAKRGEIA